ncbi:GNAT family N-acetyltransferase [Corynebacterium sp. NPDC060344]|uniref:GNAT family N-acetyltransferase n=1 Tax=Corynebacterium sp. NPDC060344 TaxID=3347101 RepID=UPI003668534F
MRYSVLPLPEPIFRLRLHEAVSLYVGAMGYDPSIVDARVLAWARARHEPGWSAVAAVAHPEDVAPHVALADPAFPLAGIAYCQQGTSTQWWHVQVRAGLAARRTPIHAARDILGDYVELAEIHVDPGHQGARIGERLLHELMRGRPERRVLLSTPEVPAEANRAWRLYRRLGFTDVLRNFHFAGDSRPFAVLGARLPLARVDSLDDESAPTQSSPSNEEGPA